MAMAGIGTRIASLGDHAATPTADFLPFIGQRNVDRGFQVAATGRHLARTAAIKAFMFSVSRPKCRSAPVGTIAPCQHRKDSLDQSDLSPAPRRVAPRERRPRGISVREYGHKCLDFFPVVTFDPLGPHTVTVQILLGKEIRFRLDRWDVVSKPISRASYFEGRRRGGVSPCSVSQKTAGVRDHETEQLKPGAQAACCREHPIPARRNRQISTGP